MSEANFESFAERFCDGYCKFPYICKTQEEMETVCNSCPLKELEELVKKSSGGVKKMTYEEVKRIRSNPTAEDVNNKELSEMIDRAVDKQIPQKPYKVEFGAVALCPNCEEVLDYNGVNHFPYCAECGQKIVWSEEK